MPKHSHCNRCGKDCRLFDYSFNFVPYGALTELRFTYNQWGVTHVCESCGDVCDSIVGYWGKKKPKDILALMYYLQSGSVSKPRTDKLYNTLMNGGYYE